MKKVKIENQEIECVNQKSYQHNRLFITLVILGQCNFLILLRYDSKKLLKSSMICLGVSMELSTNMSQRMDDDDVSRIFL